ncbi:MAG: glycosyltransferase [Balneolales bacterium]
MTWLHQLISGLESHCLNIVLCEKTDHPSNFQVAPLYQFDALPLPTQWFQRFLQKSGIRKTLPFYLETLRNEKIQLIHSHFGHTACSGSKLAIAGKIPHVASFYGMDIRQIPESDTRWYKRYKEMFKQTARIFCEGPHMATAIEKLGCPTDKIVIHPLGIDIERIVLRPRTWDGQSELRILVAASFREKKGIPLALKAVAALLDRYKIKVTLIGDGSTDRASQAEKTRILETIRQNKLENVVHLTGFQPHDEMLKIAEDHHIFLSPSLHAKDGDCEGGVPVSIIEMSASGMVVVSTRHCDIPGVIIDGQTGWLAEEAVLDDLVIQLQNAIESCNEWPQMARRARHHIQTHFDARIQTDRLYEQYQYVIHT